MKSERRWVVNLVSLRIVRYCGVGVFVNGAGYALFLLMILVGLSHKLSASLTYFLGVLASFVLNRALVFRSVVTWRSGFFRLCIMLSLGYAINISMLYVGVDVFKLPASIVQLVSIVCVSVFFYCVNKWFVHKESEV
ncbi:GtrA family protein [Pseudomonas sp. SDO5271_S396]